MSVNDVARRLGQCFDDDGIAYAIGGALALGEAMRERSKRVLDPTGAALSFISAEDLCLHKLLFNRAKDIVDLERLLAVRPELDLGYVRGWLTQMVPVGDQRLVLLEDLERRFAPG